MTTPSFPITLTRLTITITCFLACQSTIVPPLEAAVIIDLEQEGNDVTATLQGSIDLTGLSLQSSNVAYSGSFIPLYTELTFGVNDFTGPEASIYYIPSINGPPGSWGPGVPFGPQPNPTISTGDQFAFVPLTNFQTPQPYVSVPIGYISGSSLSGTMTWTNATLTSLGINPGIYEYTYGPNSDQTIEIDIGTVPEPSSLVIFGGLGLMAWGFRKRFGLGGRP